jgi:hypothetical protein
LLTHPDKWKWASSLESTTSFAGTFCRIAWQESLRLTQSHRFSSWTTIILWEWNLRSVCKILLTLHSDIPIAAACFRDERRGDCVMACLTAWTFCGDRTLRGLPGGFFFKAEPVALKFATHNSMVFLSGTVAFRPSLKCVRTNRWLAMTDSAFFKYISATYAQCSPLHAMTAPEMVRHVLLTDTSPAHPAQLAPEQRRRQIREYFCRILFVGSSPRNHACYMACPSCSPWFVPPDIWCRLQIMEFVVRFSPACW